MPQTPHIEKHFTASETVRDIVIGMSDGLTVPFALAAGLSGAVDSTALIITAGLAEVAAGAIAMGLGATWQREPMRSTLLQNGLGKNAKRRRFPKPKPPRLPRSSAATVSPRTP